MFHDMGEWGWGMGFGWFFMLLFWALVILGIAAIVKWLSGSGGGNARSKTALEILQERYARGEIDQQEYQQKRRDLES
ncbi:MAG TPA: SHOCT domain-containing protein [Gammaproteobacteria bacterium]